MNHRKISAGLGGLALVGGLAVTGATLTGAQASTPAAATASSVTAVSAAHPGKHAKHSKHGKQGRYGKKVSGSFVALNNSGVRGWADVKVKGNWVNVRIKATGLLADQPHAQHFHFSADTSHTCPTNAQDTNGDRRINVAEGSVTYGAIVNSLTTKGDTSPESALAVDRFSTAPGGVERYQRSFKVTDEVAAALKAGDVHIIIHGLDYNGNGEYDLDGAGESEIAPGLPAEATDPAACAELG